MREGKAKTEKTIMDVLKTDAASVGPPPTAPLGGGCGLLWDVEEFSTKAFMEQKAAETRRESPDAEPARLWGLQVEFDTDPKSHGIARDAWGRWHIVSSSAEDNSYDTRAEALEAWDKSRKVDSTTNEYKPPATVDFEQGGHKGP